MPEDMPQGEEQHEMLSFTEAAERLVEDGIAPNMTAEGLRRLARDPNSGWPIGPAEYRVVGKTRMLPYDQLAPYMRERFGKRRGRGPDTKKRSPKPKPQGESMATTADPRNAVLSAMAHPPYNEIAEARGVPWADAVKLLDAYRAAVLEEAANALACLGPADSLASAPQAWDEAVESLRRMAEQSEAQDG
jgi:hypothetical protein